MELIVIMAIIGVLIGLATMSAASLTGAGAKKCASKTKSALETIRTSTMANREEVSVITKTSSGYLITSTVTSGTGSVATKYYSIDTPNATLSYSLDGTNYTAIDESGITVEFNRSAGALTTFAGSVSESAAACYLQATQGKYTYTLTIYADTGTIVESND